MARDTRERILDTALSQFAARGVEAVAVTDIEQGAGLKPGSGSFYRHFRSKDDVLAAVVDREIDRAQARRAARQGETLTEEYAQALEALDALRPLIALIVRSGTRLPHIERIGEALARTGAQLDANRLKERMDQGTVLTRDPVAVASVVQMALVGRHLAEQFFGEGAGVDRERFVDALADLVGR